jgi:BirA family biotin operon repressor/biotin-[acetyl-CoA-carboxylase] ligase
MSGIDWKRAGEILSGAGMGWVIESALEMPSTQSRAKAAARAGAPHGAVFVTDRQTAGRGRRDRSWQSSAGKDLTFSVVLRLDVETRHAHLSGLAAALAVESVLGKKIHDFPGSAKRIGIKWPNDVLAGGKKICGIICESAGANERADYIVLGIGINVNGKPDVATATSISAETGGQTDLPELLADVLTELQERVRLITSEDLRRRLVGDYRRSCSTIGREVRVISDDGEFCGVAVDITDDGAIALKAPDGGVTVHRAADVIHAKI